MHLTRLRAAVLGGLLVAAAVPLASSPAAALTSTSPVILRGSASDGTDLAGGTHSARVSPDGAWFGFSRLAAGGGAYRKSLLSGATQLVSLNDAGQPANQPATVVGIADSGISVVFATAATNMGEGPATALDLYVRNTAYGTTDRVNLLPNGTPVAVKPGQGAVAQFALFVAFTSAATNHVYVRNVFDAQTDQVDVSSAEVGTAGGSKDPALSPDGRYVTFTSSGSDLVAADTNFVPDVFRRDRQAGTTTRVSVSDGEAQLNLGSGQSSVSADGRYVAFTSEATNAGTAADTNDSTDVYRRDTTGGYTLLVSQQPNGTKADHDSSHPDVSADGGLVAFESKADNLDTAPDNGKVDTFVRTVATAQLRQVGLLANVGPYQGTFAPSLADDGRTVAFESASSLSYPDANGAPDAFVERNDPLGPFTSYGPLVSRMIADFGIDASSAQTYQQTQLLAGGKVTPSHLVLGYAHAPGWAEDRAPVIRLYEAFFHRRPDLGGLSHWIKKRQGGTKLGVIASAFSASSEFTTTYGNVSNSAFVSLVYANVLDRPADGPGLAHWVGKMASGMTRGDVMVAFSESSEGVRTLSVPVDASLVGLALFGGLPSKDLYDAAGHKAGDMGENEWIVAVYLQSQEYAAHLAS